LRRSSYNFALTEDDNDRVIRPKNYEGVEKREIIPAIKAHYFNDDSLQKVYREAKKFFHEYMKIPTRTELREVCNLTNLNYPRRQI